VQFGVTIASLALGGIGEPALAGALSMCCLPLLHWLPGISPHPRAVRALYCRRHRLRLITYFEVLLGELVPKSLALQRAERIALAVAGPSTSSSA
jgi:putative hemolysin